MQNAMGKPRKETFCVLVREVFYRLKLNVALFAVQQIASKLKL